ncbi:MAG: hypothetical protein V4584_02830 [Verrucomicrobiota bacterium]
MKVLYVLLAAAWTAHAAPSDPGKAALDFLEKVRERKLNLEPGGDTALSAGTAAEKRSAIARRLERLAGELGNDPLEVGAVKLDEDYAGVIVRKTGGFDPGRLRVFPIALVKRGAEWWVAPVPASFENAGAGYAITLKKRLESLENWMLREQVVDLEKLREESAERMRQKIEVNLTEKELRGFNARQVGERFMAACAAKDLPSVLGLLGGLAEKLPEDWPARLKAADRAMKMGEKPPHAWHLMSAPEVVRVLVQDEEQARHGSVSIACLDPAGNAGESQAPRIEVINLGLTRGEEGLWQLNPPADFLEEEEEAAEDHDETLDPDLVNLFPKKWREAHPPAVQATAELAWKELAAGLASENLTRLLTLSKLDGEADPARASCTRAAKIWWMIHAPSTVSQALPLEFKADETLAAGVFQFFSARDPDQWEPRTFYFEKTPTGWLWTPFPSLNTAAKYKDWVDDTTRRWTENWQQSLLGGSPVIRKIGDLPPPTEDEARECVEAWFDATRRGDVQAALGLAARLGEGRSGTVTLQNLGYEIVGARKNPTPPAVTGIYKGKLWTAVAVKSEQAGRPVYPLYPVIRTPQGPRILIEVDLFAAGNRGRDFLNRAAFERLEPFGSAESVAELRELYSRHEANVAESLGKKPR